MEEFAKNLTSLSWWLGVVAVGLAINIASAYMKGPLDALLSGWSTRWNSRSVRQREARRARIREVSESDREFQLLIAAELRDRIRAVHTMLFSVLLILLYVFIRVRIPSVEALHSDLFLSLLLPTLYWGSLFMLFLSMHSFMRAMSSLSILNDAKR